MTYGYSRDHRADLKQWMLALATTRQGDVPMFCQALDGNARDKVSLVRSLPPNGPPHHEIAGLEPLHRQVVRLLGPYCGKLYELGV